MFGTVDIKARPVRFAYLVDPGNVQQIREAIRLSSTLWGGANFPIITMYRRMPKSWREKPFKSPPAKNVVLGYLDAFDPDFLVQLCNEVPTFVGATGHTIIKPEDVWKPHREHRRSEPQYGIGIFELLGDLFEQHFKYKAKYPVRVVLPRLPDRLTLFWASIFGDIHSDVIQTLEKHYAEPLEIEHIDASPDAFKELLARDVIFPRRLSQHGLTREPKNSRIRGDARVYFLDAASTEDIVDFWNVRALGGPVLPLPKQFKDHPQFREVLEGFLRAHRRHWPHNQQVCDVASIIRSRHSTMEELQDFAKTLRLERDDKDPSTDGFFSLQHWYPRVWDEWARDKDGAVPDDWYAEDQESVDVRDTKDLTVHFNLVLPAFAERHGVYSEGRCANEIAFRFYGATEYVAEVIPPSAGSLLGQVVSGRASLRGDWRVGRNGLVAIVKYQRSETRVIPSAEAVVFAWLTDQGWKPSLSPPGLLAKQIYRQCEGHIGFLANPKVLGLLEHMNGGKVRADGTPIEEDSVTQERELPVQEVKNRLRAASKHGNLHEHMLSRGIFRLGLRAKCPHCMRHSWFPLDTMGNEFTCPKCLNTFAAAGSLDRSSWCYKTTGPFSVPGYADGAYAVLLTLQCFSEHRMSTMRISPAFSFVAEKSKSDVVEADFALLWQESPFGERKDGLIFGECKTFGRFAERDFERMRRVAETFPGAVLVFSTLRSSLSSEEVKKITRIAKAGRKYWKAERPINPVLVLTGTEILSWHGPPYCWDERTQERFRHVYGLLQLCDATQQLYLNLPSWHTDWHERWEKRRQRYQAKKAAGGAA